MFWSARDQVNSPGSDVLRDVAIGIVFTLVGGLATYLVLEVVVIYLDCVLVSDMVILLVSEHFNDMVSDLANFCLLVWSVIL
jgi:hypothetical protein